MRLDKNRGFSLLELVIVVIVIGLLLTFGVDRLLALRVEAERAAMESTLGALRSALGLKVAENIVKKKVAALPALAGSNPMDRLSEKPKNYLGELTAPDPGTIEGGVWYFDTGNGTLVYRVSNSAHFSSSLPGPARARFTIQLDFEDVNSDGRFDPAIDKIGGLRLQEVEPYRWTKIPLMGP